MRDNSSFCIKGLSDIHVYIDTEILVIYLPDS